MKICNNCRQEIKENSMYCGYCDAKQSEINIISQTNNQTSIIPNNKITSEEVNKNQQQITNTTNYTTINNNNDNNKPHQIKKEKKKRRKYKFLVLLIVLVLIFLTIKGINTYKKTLDKIYITTRDVIEKKDNTEFYKIDEKINDLNLKIKTFKKVKNTTIRLSSYNLILYEEEYINDKKWKLKDISLPIGTSDLEVKVTLENDQIIERKITLYNTNEENLGNLDTNDTDNDQLLNYQEEIYGTNKNKKDTDNDGLTDYQEIIYTNTDPTKYSTYKEGVSDANDDYDADGLTNLKELQLNTNPILYDTDSDRLNDYNELQNKTNPIIFDTDGDGVSDYDEVINFKTDPNTKTTVFSGKVESQNKEVGITLNNLSVNDIGKVKFEESGFSILNENIIGYIMPAYNISTTIPFTSSEITFNYENYKLEENAIPTIYYYNEESGFLEELPTRIEGKTATTTVTHFSTYILIDKNLYNDINQIDSNSSQVEITEKTNGEYIFFVSPLAAEFVNIPLQILTSPDITEKQAERLKEEIRLTLKLDYPIELKRIKSKTGFDLMKKLYDTIYDGLYNFMVSLELADLFATINISDDSYYHNIADVLLIGYMQNTKDLGIFVSDNNENIFEDDNILLDLEDQTDSNNDGITDSFTLAILSGDIRTSTGINPFEGYSFEEIQKNNDLDKDGIKNGEEIKITENENGKFYIEMISNPTLKDSDYDGLDDKEDTTPLKSNTPGFTVSGKLNDNIDIWYLEREVNNYNRLFDTGEFDYKNGKIFSIKYQENGITKYSPNGGLNLLGESGAVALRGGIPLANELFGTGDAKKALDRYYSKEANIYTEKDLVEPSLLENGEINSQSIFGSTDTQNYLKINAQKIIDISEDTIKNGESKVIKTTKSLIGTSQNDGFDQNENVWGFLHSSSSHAIANVSNKNDKFTMKLRYFILDVYDWKNAEECNIKDTFCAIEVDYFNDMLLGNAKAFFVKIEYDMEITWKKGGTPTMKLLTGTPYA